MTRVAGSQWAYWPSVQLTIALVLGPCDAYDLTDEQLRIGWRVEGAALMDHCLRSPHPPWRPWGWWEFVACEPQPEGDAAEARRLAELGETVDALARV